METWFMPFQKTAFWVLSRRIQGMNRQGTGIGVGLNRWDLSMSTEDASDD